MKLVKLMGGLGNQMFQYAFSKALNENCTFLFGDYKKHGHRKLELKYFKCKYTYIPRILYRYLNFIFKNFKQIEDYNSGVFNDYSYTSSNEYKNCIYIGFYQTEKYFKHIRQQLLKDFEPQKPLDKKNTEIIYNIRNSNSVSVHIRRTDYTDKNNEKIYGKTDLEYYQNAITYISEHVKNPKFFFFSDDMKFVKENFNHLKFEHEFIDINKGKNSYKDLLLMKNCKHNIIPNSTFAWWGAWLNENPDKIIIAPKIWFHDNPARSKDLVPQEWIKL